ncbi:hypothetical protein [Photorhabdus sp. RW14-46]|nr:hypothetical protein [Photorhabdus sp. RW14-46]
MTGVSECSQQRGNLKDNGYNCGFFVAIKVYTSKVYTSRQAFLVTDNRQ